MESSSKSSNQDLAEFESMQLEQRQDLVLQQLDDLNERIENLIDLYTRLRKEDREANLEPQAGTEATDLDSTSAEDESLHDTEVMPKAA